MGTRNFANGDILRVKDFCLNFHISPDENSENITQALYGEEVEIIEIQGAFAKARTIFDSYIGFCKISGLGEKLPVPNAVIINKSAIIKSLPKVQSVTIGFLSLGALVALTGKNENGFCEIENLGFIHAPQLMELGKLKQNPSFWARQFENIPYLWGGRGYGGIDCSGLVQMAFKMAGIALPRDSKDQFLKGNEIGQSELQENDLVFWKGHVGLMLDSENFIHANAFHGLAKIEPLAEAMKRIASSGLEIIGCRRI